MQALPGACAASSPSSPPPAFPDSLARARSRRWRRAGLGPVRERGAIRVSFGRPRASGRDASPPGAHRRRQPRGQLLFSGQRRGRPLHGEVGGWGGRFVGSREGPEGINLQGRPAGSGPREGGGGAARRAALRAGSCAPPSCEAARAVRGRGGRPPLLRHGWLRVVLPLRRERKKRSGFQESAKLRNKRVHQPRAGRSVDGQVGFPVFSSRCAGRIVASHQPQRSARRIPAVRGGCGYIVSLDCLLTFARY